MNIGQRLRLARKSKGITQENLAAKIGASRGVITNIEHNKTDSQQPMVVEAICKELGINKEWFLTGNGEMNATETEDKVILSEIRKYAEKLSEKEQEFILEAIKLYSNHMAEKNSADSNGQDA